MNGLGGIIQFMLFIIVILIMAKLFGFADNGIAVLAACVLGGLVYGLIYLISNNIRKRREYKASEDAFKRKRKPDRK